jgi:hypothetical protein
MNNVPPGSLQCLAKPQRAGVHVEPDFAAASRH